MQKSQKGKCLKYVDKGYKSRVEWLQITRISKIYLCMPGWGCWAAPTSPGRAGCPPWEASRDRSPTVSRKQGSALPVLPKSHPVVKVSINITQIGLQSIIYCTKKTYKKYYGKKKIKNKCILGPGIEPGSQQCECRVLTAILSKQRDRKKSKKHNIPLRRPSLKA